MERSRSRPSSPKPDDEIGHLLRPLAPQVLGGLLRRYRTFDRCEDAVQEAMLEAAMQWPEKGIPQNPRAWLTTVASRRFVDALRSDGARRAREERHASELFDGGRDAGVSDEDDSLRMLLLCAHPALTTASQIALTLRAIGGLTTAEIAAALLVPEATMATRISRAKQKIDGFPEGDPAQRLPTVLHVLYLIFNEGYTASSGPDLARVELTAEAIRLTRMAHAPAPDPEVTGLLALMLLTEARTPTRTTPDGDLVPLADQDRSWWRRDLIDEGVALITAALPVGPVGPYQLQAAIAAAHVEGPESDWPQVLALYGMLEQVAPGPMVTLNRAVAVAEVHGPAAALALIEALETDERMSGHHRLHAARAHLLERIGDTAGAARSYRLAAGLTESLPEQRYLLRRADLRSEYLDEGDPRC